MRWDAINTCSRRQERIGLCAVLALFAAQSLIGLCWGLPARTIDKYLFSDDKPWDGQTIFHLAGAAGKFSPRRGADVDADPRQTSSNDPILLTATERDVARIYLRYRLYTFQPDEMITMMALAGMSPGHLQFDPRLYQYGGLFIYPVGGLIGLSGALGLIDVRSDVAFYVDRPEEFAKFYVVARLYSASWGLLGVLVVFFLGKRLGGPLAGLLAALLFALLPVVTCMAHEGKPHLPGAVLMLCAVFLAMQHLSCEATDSSTANPQPAGGKRHWWLMCICCGGAVGMVLSSWPIVLLIPLASLLDRRRGLRRVGCQGAAGGGLDGPHWQRTGKSALVTVLRSLSGLAVSAAVYLLVNPYIAINAFTNRDVLYSNFGNSLAMYEIARVGEGLVRVAELTAAGATWPVFVLGVIGLVLAVSRRPATALLLVVPAAALFIQFVLIGAGKPAEYGRFGVFTNSALAIGCACLLTKDRLRLHPAINLTLVSLVVVWAGLCSASYLWSFHADSGNENVRLRLAASIARGIESAATDNERLVVGLQAEPAPYGCPPMDFSSVDLVLVRDAAQLDRLFPGRRRILLHPIDKIQQGSAGAVHWRSFLNALHEPVISWANKPFRAVGLPADEVSD